jgi:hypothetical protein
MRSIALSSNDATMYTGWIQGSSSRAVFLHNAGTGAVSSTFNYGATQPNTLATDDRGNVYAGTADSNFQIFNSTLTSSFATQATGAIVEGIDVFRQGASYFAYVSRSNGTVQRYDVTNVGSPSLDATFGTGGTFTVPGAGQLRGLDVNAAGEVFVAQRDTTGSDRAGKVYKLTSGTSPTVTSIGVTGAMDVVQFGNKIYVTEYNGTSSAIAVLDASTLVLLDTWATGIPRANTEGYAMIDVDSSGRLYLVDQIYGTASGSTLDRVLISTAVPEPSTIVLAGFGALGTLWLGWRRRSRR